MDKDIEVLVYYQVKKFKESYDLSQLLSVPPYYLGGLYMQRDSVKKYLDEQGIKYRENSVIGDYNGWQLGNREDAPDELRGYGDKKNTIGVHTSPKNYKITLIR